MFSWNENMYFRLIDNTVEIEIKQNQENMEERKYSEEEFKSNPRFQHHKNIEQVVNMQKMKPFNLEAAKQGQPVCTRDGRKARIICFDRFDRKEANKQIVTLVQDDDREFPYCHDLEGKYLPNNNLDLMMLSKKHEGWVNVHKLVIGYETGKIYATEEEAKAVACTGCMATVKIEWYE